MVQHTWYSFLLRVQWFEVSVFAGERDDRKEYIRRLDITSLESLSTNSASVSTSLFTHYLQFDFTQTGNMISKTFFALSFLTIAVVAQFPAIPEW